MRKCMMNALSMGCIAVGSFLMGGALGLALSKDESDIFEENCIKMEDFDENYFLYGESTESSKCVFEGSLDDQTRKESQDSYDRMTKELYGPDRAKIIDPYPEGIEEISEDDIYNYPDEAENKSVETTTIVDEDGIAFKHTSEGLEGVIEPYIISEDDYWDPNQYMDFAQENLVYYAKDDVLTTERDEVITDIDDVVGPHALTSFGSMCLDKDTVFVRNNRLKMEYEITRDEGSYQEVVLGYSDEEEEAAYKKAKQYFKQLEKEEEGATT